MAFDIDGIFNFGSKVIERIWPDPTEAEKAKIRLAELAQSGELAELANKSDMFKTEVEDRKSAREREAAIATAEAAPLLNKVVTPVLAISIVVLTFLLFGLVLLDGDAIDDTRKDLAIYVLGALSGICGMVASYYFGSSSGSSAKNQVIEDLMKRRRG